MFTYSSAQAQPRAPRASAGSDDGGPSDRRTGAPEGDPAVEGIAILSFDDRQAYERAIASPEFAAAIGDAPNFQDTAATTALFADEYVIV